MAAEARTALYLSLRQRFSNRLNVKHKSAIFKLTIKLITIPPPTGSQTPSLAVVKGWYEPGKGGGIRLCKQLPAGATLFFILQTCLPLS
ncbi:hypothetical protein J6590_020167 [Homalodisca vitripennis]|nr:hypothetical protein J6590_020167 [Homalodisca vitripennis]